MLKMLDFNLQVQLEVFFNTIHLRIPAAPTAVRVSNDAACFVYTCRRLIDLSLIAVCFVYTCRRLIDLSLIAGAGC